MNNTNYTNQSCPFLGLIEDSDTSLAFPSVGNGCHRSRPVASPNLKHQAEYCLAENHQKCPIFLEQNVTQSLPHHLISSKERTRSSRKNQNRILVITLGVVSFAGLFWGLSARRQIQPEDTFTPSAPPPSMAAELSSPTTVLLSPTDTSTVTVLPPSETATNAPESIVIATPTLAPTLTQTETPTPTQTVTITASPEPTRTPTLTKTIAPPPTSVQSKHGLDMPIGGKYKFVIHLVQGGENFNQYAEKYNTSVDAIVAVNFNLKSPVWVDTPVVIPVGFTDVSSLPVFEAYEVTQSGVSLETLARELGVSVDELKSFNAIDQVESGDWLLIPRSKTAP